MPPIGLILLILLVALPLLEIALLIKVGAIIGLWMTLAIIVATFVAGIVVVQHQGLGVARRLMASARDGTPPVVPIMEGMLLMIAGGCLILPGLITDSIGLLLLVPPLRRACARWIVKSGMPLTVRVHRHRRHHGQPRPPSRGPAETIDGVFERIDEPKSDHAARPPGPPQAG
jgi:UPF0716 protein FxsA